MSKDGSLAGSRSLEELLEKHLPPEALAEARRYLQGTRKKKLKIYSLFSYYLAYFKLIFVVVLLRDLSRPPYHH